jgi:hypothetical protein
MCLFEAGVYDWYDGKGLPRSRRSARSMSAGIADQPIPVRSTTRARYP